MRGREERDWIFCPVPVGLLLAECVHNPSSNSWQATPSTQLSLFIYLVSVPFSSPSRLTESEDLPTTTPGRCIILYALLYSAFTFLFKESNLFI